MWLMASIAREPASVGPGRPRDDTMGPRILVAAQKELAENGVVRFSVRAVARRAGVAPRSVTIRWPEVDTLLLEALSTDANARYRPTGDLTTDLLSLGSEIIARLRTSSFELQLRLAADARSSPELYAGFQQVGLQPVFNSVRETFLDGQRSGVVREGSAEWMAHAFIGGLIMRTLANPGRMAVSQDELQLFVADLSTWLSAGSSG
jgi:AcrR family transcriptional regulator